VYGWEEFSGFIMGDEQPQAERSQEAEDILAAIPKGLDDDTKAMLKLDNFAKTFEVLAQKSVDDEGGCAQIKYSLVNADSLEEPLWHAVIAVAKFCDDGATAIHELSKPDPRYTYEETENVAALAPAPRTCKWYIDHYPERCKGCQHRGKISSPIQLGRVFKPAPATNKEDAVRQDKNPQAIPDFPEYLFP
jgi:hypothetical protein